MSQEDQIICQNDIIEELLPQQWTVWFSYTSDTNNDINYANNLMQIQKLKSWSDFKAIWSWVSKTYKFFVNPQTGTFNKYKFGIEERKIDSINFFKGQIQPQWEYGQNHKYGYFNFGIDRDDQRIDQIYEASIFLAIGFEQQISKNIIGIRIVDIGSKISHQSRARIQIWVDFRHDNSQQSLNRLLKYQQNLIKYYKQAIEYKLDQVRFFNIQNQQKDNNVKKSLKPNQGKYQNQKGYNKEKYQKR